MGLYVAHGGDEEGERSPQGRVVRVLFLQSRVLSPPSIQNVSPLYVDSLFAVYQVLYHLKTIVMSLSFFPPLSYNKAKSVIGQYATVVFRISVA